MAPAQRTALEKPCAYSQLLRSDFSSETRGKPQCAICVLSSSAGVMPIQQSMGVRFLAASLIHLPALLAGVSALGELLDPSEVSAKKGLSTLESASPPSKAHF